MVKRFPGPRFINIATWLGKMRLVEYSTHAQSVAPAALQRAQVRNAGRDAETTRKVKTIREQKAFFARKNKTESIDDGKKR